MSIETIENAYEAASAKNGSARPSWNSAPPTGGPTIPTADMRARPAATAAGSSDRDTTARSAPGCAERNRVPHAPATNAASRTCQNLTRSSRIAAPRPATATARTASAPIISHFRFQRSAATPASTPNAA